MTARRLWLEEPSYFGSVGVCDWCRGQWGPFSDLDQAADYLQAHWRMVHSGARNAGAGIAPVVHREPIGLCKTGCGRHINYPGAGLCRPCYKRRRRAEGKGAAA